MKRILASSFMMASIATAMMADPKGQSLPKRRRGGYDPEPTPRLPNRSSNFGMPDRIAKFFLHLNQMNADRAKLNGKFNTHVFTKQVSVYAINQKLAVRRLEWLLKEHGITADILAQIETKMAEEVKQITEKHDPK